MRRLWILISCCAFAADHYVFSGELKKLDVYQHGQMLLIKNVASLALIEQPIMPVQSYLSDISKSDVVISIEKNSYCTVKKTNVLTVDCYNHDEDEGKLHILVDAGHGGKDSGAVSATGLKEKHVTLSYVNKLAQYLQRPWVKIDLTRQQDVYIDKYDRLKTILKLKPDMVLSVHADAYVEPSAQGVGIFCLNESEGSLLTQSLIKGYTSSNDVRLDSKAFGNHVLSLLRGQYKLHASKVLELPLVILRSPVSLSILLELGFLSNPEEAAYLGSENYLEGFAEEMADILLEVWKERENIIYVASFD